MSPSASNSAHRADSQNAPIVLAAVLFWLFSYAMFTSRVQLGSGEGEIALFTYRRLLTTAAGSLLYAAILRFMIFPPGRRPAHPLALVALVVPAAAAMVVFRMVIDPLVSPEPLPLASHLRWVSVWAGYFGLWLAAVLAWRMYADRAVAPREMPAAIATHADRTVARITRDDLENIIAAAADEAARLPLADRQLLIERLRFGYAVADDPFGTQSAREAIVAGIADRLALAPAASRREPTLRS